MQSIISMHEFMGGRVRTEYEIKSGDSYSLLAQKKLGSYKLVSQKMCDANKKFEYIHLENSYSIAAKIPLQP